jgi:hypothetical protein
MARSPANGAGSVAEATTLIFPKQSVWQDLAKTKRETKKRAASHTGIYGAAVKNAVEKDHIDRKALSIVLKLEAMEDDDLHVTVHHMIDGMKKLGVLKRAMAQEEMFDDHKIDADALETAAGKKAGKGAAGSRKGGTKGGGRAPRASNVVQIGDAARQVAEAAGADKS